MIRFKDCLASADNLVSWKHRIMMLLKANKIEPFVKEEKEEQNDYPEKTQWIMNNEKAMKTVVDAVQDHIVPIVGKHEIAYHMLKALEDAFVINNIGRTLALKRQMNHISMNKGASINAFFMRITELRDQLSSVGYEVDIKELSLIALGDLPNSWESFV